MNWSTYYLDPNLNTYAREKTIEQYRNEEPVRGMRTQDTITSRACAEIAPNPADNKGEAQCQIHFRK
jgi:hypothetical protein